MADRHDSDSELQNKLVKHYWVPCLIRNQVDLNMVDGSNDFSVIPTNSRGKIPLEVGDLRDIVKECIKQARVGYTKIRGLKS